MGNRVGKPKIKNLLCQPAKRRSRPPVAENIDMATAKITLSASPDIPFNKLVLSQSNAAG